MRKKTIAHSFMKLGKRYYVPISSDKIQSTEYVASPLPKYKKYILKKWDYPEYMFNVAVGGHIAALNTHLNNSYFAVVDLKSFYETITATKIYRALRRIGLPHRVAYELTGESTIKSTDVVHLPRGFQQSSLIASLVFDQSLVGSIIRSKRLSAKISIYNDDIIISSNNLCSLKIDYYILLEVLKESNFALNETKTQVPNTAVNVFNLRLTCGNITPQLR